MRRVWKSIAGVGLPAAVAALAAAHAPARAQDAGDVVAYFVLNATPQGSFAPLVTPAMLGETPTGGAFIMRYGRVDLFEDAANNFAFTFLSPGGPHGSLTFTAGYWNPDCDGCDGHLMLGVGMDGRLATAPLSATPDAAQIVVGLNGEVGFAKPESATLWSATVGLPVSLVGRSAEGLRIAPFLTPGFGFGYATGGGTSESGTRFMIGGGLGIRAAAGFLFNAGFQKVLIEDGRTTIGLNVGFRM